MIAVLVVCLAVCFAAPLALVERRPTIGAEARSPLDESEVGLVSGRLIGDLSCRAYHDGMARLARLCAGLAPSDWALLYPPADDDHDDVDRAHDA